MLYSNHPTPTQTRLHYPFSSIFLAHSSSPPLPLPLPSLPFFLLSLLSSYLFVLLSFSFKLFPSLLGPSQKHTVLRINLSVNLDSLNMSSLGQSMRKMEVTLLVGNSGIGNPRNLRRRSRKKHRRRPRGNNVRTIVPKRRPE